MIPKIDLKFILTNVFATIVLVVITEILLGFGLKYPDLIPGFMLKYYQEFYKKQDRNIIQVTACGEYDPHLFYRLKTGRCRFQNREFDVATNINSAGLRDDERSLKDASIVFLGDSFTMGWGVDEDETFPALTEKIRNVNVLNAGVSSYGTAREVMLLEKLGFKRINTLVIQYHPNDFQENRTYRQHNYVLPVRTSDQYDSLKREITKRTGYYPFKNFIGLTKEFAKSMVTKTEHTNDTTEAKLFLDILLNAGVHEVASSIIVFEIDFHKDLNNGFINALEYLMQNEEYKKLNLTTVRMDDLMAEEDYFILDDHINAKGHSKISSRLNEIFSRETLASDKDTQANVSE
jgi:hypothetical protein